MKRALLAVPILFSCTLEPGIYRPRVARHSSSIAISADESLLYVVDPEADAVSFLDPRTRSIVREIPLGPTPAVDANGNYWVSVQPRALADSPARHRLYVSGHRSGKLYVLDDRTGTPVANVELGSEPAGVLVSPDERAIFVALAQDDEVVRVDADTLAVTARKRVAAKPWALAWRGDALLVTHLLGPGVTALDGAAHELRADSLDARLTVGDGAAQADARIPHGPSRGLYDVAVRPGTEEAWVVHMMLGIDTPQPALDFERTAFPAVSVLAPDGAQKDRMSIHVQDLPQSGGAFGDVVSGPHAIEFTPDGAYALVVDAASEDVLVIDARTHREAALVRPLPGHFPDGIVTSRDGRTAWVYQRSSNDVAVLAVREDARGISVTVDGPPIRALAGDPMPAKMRLGQRVFYSANSDEMPITTDHWVACASCHVEGRSDAVTWLFEAGPRDTPSNAGGLLDTGFLFRTADRRSVREYFHTINIEQGGHFSPDDPKLTPLLDALDAFVNHALPPPVPPRTDALRVARGKELFERADVGCASCHGGPAHTDSGSGNPALDYAGTVLLHDVGTCNKLKFPDVAHHDLAGKPRDPCAFDTPSLRGIADSWPYLHDGSAPTLLDVLIRTRGKMGDVTKLSPEELAALVEYLRSL